MVRLACKSILRRTALESRARGIIVDRRPLLSPFGSNNFVSEPRRIIVVVPIVGVPIQRWHRTRKHDEAPYEQDDRKK